MTTTESRYVDGNGTSYETKPEHMTQLFGRQLVPKTHPRIMFRGMLDSLAAKTMESQCVVAEEQYANAAADLQDVMAAISRILMCEVSGMPCDDCKLLGLSHDELRLYSHNPAKYCGVEHMVPHYKMGKAFVSVNALRTATRETEIAAIRAFTDEAGELTRSDIIRALNRLSSAVYIIMCRLLAGKYDAPRSAEEGRPGFWREKGTP
ncbi:MAG: hypothetical protein LUC93_06050 [Planctomycetaceae bacterium]|nr:hypothetical protein [Planctomycetaceae bacterium]